MSTDPTAGAGEGSPTMTRVSPASKAEPIVGPGPESVKPGPDRWMRPDAAGPRIAR